MFDFFDYHMLDQDKTVDSEICFESQIDTRRDFFIK